jgi:GNAT superfamily N-acetyltransferase
VYRDGALSVFALDGARQPRYCRRLCLLAKLFLDHKVVWRETAPFAFFALCEWRPAMGCRLLGYFSKELGYCSRAHTLACLLVLPAHQRKGHGALLTGLSYELARRAGAPGTPERPLSDLGLMSYGTFWKGALLRVLGEAARAGAHLSVRDLVSRTGICEADVRETLGALGLLRASGAEHALCVTPALLAAHAPAGRRRAAPAWGPPALPLVVDPSKLVWAPRHDEGVGWAAAAPDDWSSSESDADGDADADDSEHDDAGEAAARATQAADAAAVHAAQAAEAAAERALDALAAVREPATASRRRPLATGGESVNRPSQRTRSRLRMA